MDKVQLLDDLAGSFNSSELAELCLRLGIDHEELGGSGPRSQSLKLIGNMERRGRLPELIQVMIHLRPHLAEAYQSSSPTTAQSGETLASPSIAAPQPETFPTQPERQEFNNPYSAGRMVTSPVMFFGRDIERRWLRARLQNMGNSAIVGMRRVGKSSLMYHLSHHEPAFRRGDHLFAFLDLQDARYHTLAGLMNGAAAQWLPKAARYTGPDNNLADLAGFTRLVRALKTAGYTPVLCLDEFENLTKRPEEFNDDVFESWRALGNAGQLAFITVSQQPLSDLIRGSDLTSNFDNIFNQLDLALLDETAAHQLLTEPLAQSGQATDAGATAALLDYCGPHPFYLQMAGFYLCDALLNGGFTLEQVKEDFSWEVERHWRGLWRALSPAEQAAFRAAQGGAVPPASQARARALVRKGVLLAAGGGYKPFSAGFAAWVQAEEPAPAEPGPETPVPAPVEKQTEPTHPTNPTAQLDWRLLLVATFVTLLVLVVAAWVLSSLMGDTSTTNLIILLVIAFPVILVLVGKLTGQDLLGWFGQLLGREKPE